MNRFAVFLRGVNVGGVTITTAKLRAALDVAPLHDVTTLLASGNVLCTTSLGAADTKDMIEQLLREAFGYDAWVVVFTRETVEAIVDACPYAPDSTDEHAYVTLASDAAALDELVTAAVDAGGDEPVRLDRHAIAWTAPVGGTLDAPLSKVSAKKRFKETTTTRNLRTLQKVVAAP